MPGAIAGGSPGDGPVRKHRPRCPLGGQPDRRYNDDRDHIHKIRVLPLVESTRPPDARLHEAGTAMRLAETVLSALRPRRPNSWRKECSTGPRGLVMCRLTFRGSRPPCRPPHRFIRTTAAQAGTVSMGHPSPARIRAYGKSRQRLRPWHARAGVSDRRFRQPESCAGSHP